MSIINSIDDPSSPNYQIPVTKSGAISAKLSSTTGRTWRRYMRIERAVRLELAAMFTEAEVAAQIGITKQALYYLKKTPEYISTRIKLSSGVISEFDKEYLSTIEASRDQLQEMLPQALLTLRNNLIRGNSQKASFQERRLATSISQDILDREQNASFSKVSKTQISLKPVENLAEWDKDAQILNAILSSNGAASRTLSAEDTGMDIFSVAALDDNSQKELQKNIKENDFNISEIENITTDVLYSHNIGSESFEEEIDNNPLPSES